MTTATPPAVHDPPLTCLPSVILAVKVKHIKHKGVVVDRRIQMVLDCGCRPFVALPLTIPAPRPGEPSHCRGAHGPFQAEEPA